MLVYGFELGPRNPGAPSFRDNFRPQMIEIQVGAGQRPEEIWSAAFDVRLKCIRIRHLTLFEIAIEFVRRGINSFA